MGSYEPKTKETAVDVDSFLESVPDPRRREDGRKLRAMMERISGCEARMWGPTIVGFGRYHYRYDSGHEGDAPRLGFSPRAKESVVYLMPGYSDREEQRARLGPHRTGKSCLYLKSLDRIDESVLEEMVTDCFEEMRRQYPEGA